MGVLDKKRPKPGPASVGGFCAFLAVWSLMLWNSFECLGTGSQDLLSRFLLEAPRKWDEYRTASKTLQGKKTGRVVIKTNERIDSESNWVEQIKQNPDCALMTISSFKGKAEKATVSERVLCANSKYAFKLWRKEAAGQRLLARLEMNPKAIISDHPRSTSEDVFYSISPHFCFLQDKLPDFIKDPNLKIELASELEDRSLVRIEFVYSEKAERGVVKAPGWMILDPRQFWCALQCELSYPEIDGTKKVFRVANTVTKGRNGLPIIQRYTFEMEAKHSSGRTNHRTGLHDYELEEVRSVPGQDFTLSAFGFREPEGIVWDEGPRYYLWLAVAGAVSLLLGFCFRRRMKGDEQAGRVS